jgi:preprotein translocase subunit SecD
MGKVKSAIITALILAVIVVAAVFSTLSFDYDNGVKRYNSVLSSITLGGDFTGYADTVIYPEGVLSNANYIQNMPEEDGDDKTDFIAKYKQIGGVWVERTTDSDGNYTDTLTVDKESVLADAEILSARFGKKGYTGYSVSIQDDYSIKISVPTGYTYSAYKKLDTSTRSTALSAVTQTVETLMMSGGLTLRNTAVGYTDNSNLDSLSLLKKTESITTYISSISQYGVGQNYAVKFNLTDDGATFIESITTEIASSDDTTMLFYVGEDQLISLTVSDAISGNSFYISTSDSATASDYAIVLSSALSGDQLTLDYSYEEITSQTSENGTSVWLFFLIGALVALVAAVVALGVKYKWLGLVKGMTLVGYALAVIYALYLLPITVTVPVAITAIGCVAISALVDVFLFEAVRKETKAGRTMQSSVKTAYKKTLLSVIDLHVVMLVASILLLLIGVGEVSSCGFTLLIGTVLSYIFYWITRFLWYVESSAAKDKFAFCGMKREVYEDD